MYDQYDGNTSYVSVATGMHVQMCNRSVYSTGLLRPSVQTHMA